MFRAFFTISLFAALSGCVPMVVSIYQPISTPITNERSMCGWPSVKTSLLDTGAVKIDLVMVPSPGIGVNELLVRVYGDTTLVFKEQRLKIESSELSSPLYAEFGQYNRGIYGEVGPLKGPASRNLFIKNIESHRPSEIKVTLPPVEINGRAQQTESVRFTLRQNPGVVGLCQ